MTTKRFLANDMSRALKKVREELGPDAIILSSKRADKGVEIIATLDSTAPSPAKAAKKQFASRFDEELDQPLSSDTEWGDHHYAERVAANTQVNPMVKSKVAASQDPATGYRQAPNQPAVSGPSKNRSPSQNPSLHHIAAQAPSASGSIPVGGELPNEPFAAAAATAERLANDIQAAHERMLKAKGRESMQEHNAPSVDAPLMQKPASIALSRHQEQPEPRGQNRQVAGFAQQVKERGLDAIETEANSDKLHSLHNEIAEMRMMLEEQMWHRQPNPSFTSDAKPLSAKAKQLAAQLHQLGLPDALIAPLLICANDNQRLSVCWQKALTMLAKKLPVNACDAIKQGGVFAFVGPTGVGKTTTVAKLAARYVLNHGRGKVAIVTTDTYRVGAHDQLKALGRILQVPVRSIEGEHQLAVILPSLKQYELVLIDTAGFRQGDAKQAQQESLLAGCPNLQRILVMASNSQAQIIKASIHAYGAKPLLGSIITKLDECASLGEAFGALACGHVPLLYSTAGQEIPDDIAVANPSELIALAIKLARNSADKSSVPGQRLNNHNHNQQGMAHGA